MTLLLQVQAPGINCINAAIMHQFYVKGDAKLRHLFKPVNISLHNQYWTNHDHFYFQFSHLRLTGKKMTETKKQTGPSCSKLTKSLVNNLLKFLT